MKAKWLAGGAGVAAGAYAVYVGSTFLRYGTRRPAAVDADPLLGLFIPESDVSERHQIRVDAPADVTFAAACAGGLGDSPLVRGLFKAREAIFGRPTQPIATPTGGVREQVTALGWGILADVPGREIVFGAVTQPWKQDVVFRAVPADEFAAFAEPGYVKILWTLRVDPVDAARSIARTETRVATTDADARCRFRWYWSFLSPGIRMIRHVMLRQIRRTAEAAHEIPDAPPEYRSMPSPS